MISRDLDRLRDQNGHLERLSSPSSWAPHPLIEITSNATLRFRIPGPEEPVSTASVHPQLGLLDAFVNLKAASDGDIAKFAQRYGPLMVFPLNEPTDGVLGESCAVWRYFAALMEAMLRIGARLSDGKRPDSSDLAQIRACPIEMGTWDFWEKQCAEAFDPMYPTWLPGEAGWMVLAYFSQSRKPRDVAYWRRHWIRLLNALIGLGRVRPWIQWPNPQERPSITYSSPNLMSYLTLQVALCACQVTAFAVCTHCQRQYTPVKRAPKAGHRNFCPECRKAKIPQLVAQRDLRARRREERKNVEAWPE